MTPEQAQQRIQRALDYIMSTRDIEPKGYASTATLWFILNGEDQ